MPLRNYLRSFHVAQWVEDLVLPQLWRRLDFWPGNFHFLRMQPKKIKFFKSGKLGVPIVAQWVRIRCRMWVRSLASLTGLWSQHCRKLKDRSQMQLKSPVAVAVVLSSTAVLIWPLDQKLPCTAGAAIKRKKKKIGKIKQDPGLVWFKSTVPAQMHIWISCQAKASGAVHWCKPHFTWITIRGTSIQ